MPDAAPRGLAPECHVETAEGPVTIAETPNKGFAVLTRLADGRLGFRQLIRLTRVGPVPRVRVVLDSGHDVVVAAAHPFYRRPMDAVPAAALRTGDVLETAYAYPDGYVPPDLPDAPPISAVRVVRVEPAADGDVMTGTVRDTHALYLAAGVLCGE